MSRSVVTDGSPLPIGAKPTIKYGLSTPTPKGSYEYTFGIKSRHKKIKSEKGPPGIGFELTQDGDYDMQHKRLTNIGDPVDYKDGVHMEYLENTFKKYLYQYGLLLDSKTNNFNAKDKKIVKVSDPQDLQDA